MIPWQQAEGWIFDLDGVVWAGAVALPGAPELVAALRAAGRRVVFLTNNSGETAAALAQKLTGLGIPAAAADVVSPVETAGSFLRERLGGPAPVLVSGVPALAAALARAGHRPVDDPDAAGAVVMGRDPLWSYARLAAVCRAVDRGVPWVALNLDRRLPLENGTWLPGLGALVASVVAATGREPEVVGKPSPLLFRAALARLGTAPDRTVMVGDTPEADVAGGRAAGLWTVLVGAAAGAPAPHGQVADPADLLRRWRAGAAPGPA